MGGRGNTVVGKMTIFDLWPLPLGGGTWCAGTNMWHPETPASYELLPALLATQILTLWMHKSRGRGRGGALILDRVDAHLWGNTKDNSRGGGGREGAICHRGMQTEQTWRIKGSEKGTATREYQVESKILEHSRNHRTVSSQRWSRARSQ